MPRMLMAATPGPVAEVRYFCAARDGDNTCCNVSADSTSSSSPWRSQGCSAQTESGFRGPRLS